VGSVDVVATCVDEPELVVVGVVVEVELVVVAGAVVVDALEVVVVDGEALTGVDAVGEEVFVVDGLGGAAELAVALPTGAAGESPAFEVEGVAGVAVPCFGSV
jgi:hypothetical protein